MLKNYPHFDLPRTVRQLIEEILAGDTFGSDKVDRRNELRHPCCRPVMLSMPGYGIEVRALCREISRSGLGLVHTVSVPASAIIVSMPLDSGKLVQLPGTVNWCRRLEVGWYISGISFTFPTSHCETVAVREP